MNFLSPRAEQEIVNKVADVLIKTLEVNSNSQTERRFLQPKEATVYAGVSRSTLTRWVEGLGLPQAKVGGIVLYDVNDLDEFIIKYKI